MKENRDLRGRSALITGASRGLGLAVAGAFVAAGADVFVCARTPGPLRRAAEELGGGIVRKDQKVFFRAGDVSRPGEAASIAGEALEKFPDLTVLVNNAGIYGPMGSLDKIEWRDFVRAVETNLFGPALMARALLPHFRRQKYGKIIQLSGGGATSPLLRLESYGASKAGAVRLAETLALDLSEYNVDVNSVAPGLLDTGMLSQVLEAGPEAVGQTYYDKMADSRSGGRCTDMSVPAALCVFLASAASDGITGRLISAVWDDYADWPNHLDELKKSDLYTLRRITGRDRNSGWGDK
jgi:3-oxoacyl-[acyl-carrier protein] reductase